MKTKVVKLATGKAAEAQLQGAAKKLRAGKLVAFPTETVYGIGANADDPRALAKLSQLKARPPAKPFTIHIADSEQVSRFVPRVVPLAERLMRRCWPGPLTLVLEKDDGSTVGLRLPDHDLARSLIRKAQVTVVAPSANPAGQPPAVTAQEVLAYLRGKIDLLLDGGATRFKKPSTVVRFAGNTFEIVREGVYSAKQVKRNLSLVILFVCTGNTCRSPIAQGLCRQMLAARLGVDTDELEEHGFIVVSAGTGSYFSGSPSSQAVEVMQSRGIDISDHLTQRLEKKLVAEADFVFAMTDTHKMRAVELCPEAGPRVTVFDVTDPFGSDIETYRKAADKIEGSLKQELEKILAPHVANHDVERRQAEE